MITFTNEAANNMKKRLKKIAEQIVQLESLKASKDDKEYQMMELIKNLSVDEMLEIDNYIIRNEMLNK